MIFQIKFEIKSQVARFQKTAPEWQAHHHSTLVVARARH